MIRRWVNKKNIVELAKYAGLVLCFVAIETIFRVQPEIRTKSRQTHECVSQLNPYNE